MDIFVSFLREQQFMAQGRWVGIHGAISAFGRQIGVPTPYNDLVTQTIHRIETGELTPGFQNPGIFSGLN